MTNARKALNDYERSLMPNNTSSSSATVSLPLATIAVVFLAVCKLQDFWGLGDLSWWWVFAPYWLGVLVFLGILLIIGVVVGAGAGILKMLDVRDSRKRAKRAAERDKNRRL